MSVEKKRAESILMIEWVFFAFAVTIVTVLTVAEIYHVFNYSRPNRDNTYFTLIGILVFVNVLITLFMNVLLTAGIKKNNSTACKTWFIISIIFIGFYILDFALALISLNFLGLAIQGCILWYRIYAVKTIIAFTRVLDDPSLETTIGGVFYSATPRAPHNEDPPSYPSAVFQKV